MQYIHTQRFGAFNGPSTGKWLMMTMGIHLKQGLAVNPLTIPLHTFHLKSDIKNQQREN